MTQEAKEKLLNANNKRVRVSDSGGDRVAISTGAGDPVVVEVVSGPVRKRAMGLVLEPAMTEGKNSFDKEFSVGEINVQLGGKNVFLQQGGQQVYTSIEQLEDILSKLKAD